jgi:hypothetical protein
MAISADPEPLALDELGWRQFVDLCVNVLKLDADLDAGSWATSESERRWHSSLASPLQLGPQTRLPGPCHIQAVWVPERTPVPRSGALQAELSALRAGLERWSGSVAVISNYAGMFSDRARLSAFLGREHPRCSGRAGCHSASTPTPVCAGRCPPC